MFVTDSQLHHSLIFSGKAGDYHGSYTKGGLLAEPANIRLVLKGLTAVNTLAYYDKKLISLTKKFYREVSLLI